MARGPCVPGNTAIVVLVRNTVLKCFARRPGTSQGPRPPTDRMPTHLLRPSFLFCAATLLAQGCVLAPPDTGGDAEPMRIVTLNGTMTEVVAALGLGDRIVGVDVTSTWPPEMETRPKVGHDRTVRAEGVLSLQPDLVIAQEGQLEGTVRDQLISAGTRVLVLRNELSVPGTKALIGMLADSLAATGARDGLLARIEADMNTVRALPDTPAVLFIYARGAGALMVAGEGTPMQRMIELAGGRNAIRGFDQFKPLTPEALIAADPDAILLFDSGLEALQGPEGLLQMPGMAATKAGRAKAFISMDGGLLSNFGPRVGEAAARLNVALRERPLAP